MSKTHSSNNPVQITRLKNGLTIVSYADKNAETFTLGVTAGVGRDHETTQNNGLSHYLEHMLFTGTKKMNQDELTEAIENEGLSINAYTSSQETTYHFTGITETLPKAMEYLSDMTLNTQFSKERLEQERAVINEEIHQHHDDPNSKGWDALAEAAYGKNSAIARPILGPAKNVNRFKKADFKEHLRKYYTGSNMVISVAGNINHDEFVKQAEEAFKGLPRGKKPNLETPKYIGGKSKHIELDSQHVKYNLAMPAVSTSHPDYMKYLVTSQVLGGGFTSRLFREIREKHGLCYSIYATISADTNNGLFLIGGSSQPKNMQKLMPLLAETLDDARKTITDEEITRTKKLLGLSIARSLETTSQKRSFITRAARTTGKVLTREERSAKLEAVTAEDVRKIITDLMSQTPTMASTGPKHKAENMQAFKKRLDCLLNANKPKKICEKPDLPKGPKS